MEKGAMHLQSLTHTIKYILQPNNSYQIYIPFYASQPFWGFSTLPQAQYILPFMPEYPADRPVRCVQLRSIRHRRP